MTDKKIAILLRSRHEKLSILLKILLQKQVPQEDEYQRVYKSLREDEYQRVYESLREFDYIYPEVLEFLKGTEYYV